MAIDVVLDNAGPTMLPTVVCLLLGWKTKAMTSELLSANWCQGQRGLVLGGTIVHSSQLDAFSNKEVLFSFIRRKHNQSLHYHIVLGHYIGSKEGYNKSSVPRNAFSKRNNEGL